MRDQKLTVQDKILLHLTRYMSYTSADPFNVPSALNQDGIGDAVGISRPHASLELKRLLRVDRVECWRAHIKGSKHSRLVYSITEEGLEHISDIVGEISSTGWSVDRYLEAIRYDPQETWLKVSDDEREEIGRVCVSKVPIHVTSLSRNVIRSVKVEGPHALISDDAKEAYMLIAGRDRVKRWNSKIADDLVGNEERAYHRLCHLMDGGRVTEARSLLVAHSNAVLRDYDRGIVKVLDDLPFKEDDTSLNGIRVSIAMECKNSRLLKDVSDCMEGSNPLESRLTLAEAFFQIARYDRSRQVSEELLKTDKDVPARIVLAKVALVSGSRQEGKDAMADLRRRLEACGDASDLREFHYLRAFNHYIQSEYAFSKACLESYVTASGYAPNREFALGLIDGIKERRMGLRFFK